MHNRRSRARCFSLMLAMLAAGAWGGCGESPPAAPGGGSGAPAPTGTTVATGGTSTGAGAATATVDDDAIPAGAPQVAVVVIDERHTDTFAKSLANLESDPPDAPFSIDNGVVRWSPELAAETDAAKLAAARLTLGNPATPLNQCTVLVIHTVRFTGKGRQWDEQRYLAFDKAPATVYLSDNFTGDTLTYDLETAETAFPFVAMSVRLMPPTPSVRIESASGGFTAALGDRSKPLTAGAPADLWQSTRAIKVSEAAVMATPIGGGAEEVFTPKVDYGAITFTTSVSVRHLGTFPGATAVAPSTEGNL